MYKYQQNLYHPCCGNRKQKGHKSTCPSLLEKSPPLKPPYFNENRFLVVDTSHPKAMEAVRELLNKGRTTNGQAN